MNAANTFNVVDGEPFTFRTMLREQKRELALEISKLSSKEREAAVCIIKKERLYEKSMQQMSLAEIEHDLDSLAASTQSEIVVYMQGRHPDCGIFRRAPLPVPQGVLHNFGGEPVNGPTWYELYSPAQDFVGRKNELAAAQDPRIHPSFASLSPFMRCHKLFAFLHTSILRLQAFLPFKPPFESLLEGTNASSIASSTYASHQSHTSHSPSLRDFWLSPSRTQTQWHPPNPYGYNKEEHEWLAGIWRVFGDVSERGSMRYNAMVNLMGMWKVYTLPRERKRKKECERDKKKESERVRARARTRTLTHFLCLAISFLLLLSLHSLSLP